MPVMTRRYSENNNQFRRYITQLKTFQLIPMNYKEAIYGTLVISASESLQTYWRQMMNQKTQSIIHCRSQLYVRIHCIITPLLIIYATIFGIFFTNIWVEIGLSSLSLLFGMFIIYKWLTVNTNKFTHHYYS